MVMSTSKIVVENIIRISKNNLKPEKGLKKIYQASGNETSLLLNHKAFQPILDRFAPKTDLSLFKNFSDWTVLDLSSEDQDLSLIGVSQSFSDKAKSIELFESLSPEKNEIAKITPLNANGFYSFTYADFKGLQQNYRQFQVVPKISENWENIFELGTEVGRVYTESGDLTVFNSEKPTKTEEQIQKLGEIADTYRSKKIFKLTKGISFNSFFPKLIGEGQSSYFIQLDHFFIFSGTVEALENCIANYQNKTLLAAQQDYKQLKENLSDESSVLMVSQNKFFRKTIADAVSPEFNDDYLKTNFTGYPLSALQMIHDEGFAHINMVISSSKNLKQGQGTFQAASIQLPETIAKNPQYFENWRNDQQFIAVQGESNTLYLYNYKGKLLWKKDLDGPILGKIQQLDIYGNKRIQMIFATPHKIHLIDKTGKEVDPFPIDFDNQITKEVAVFDYSNNHKFRFVVTQGKELFMLDKKGKTVEGFEFEGAKSQINHRPKHMRVYGKDFILVPENNGKLNILNRRGKQRVSVKESIDPSGNPWFLYQNKFTTTSKDGKLLQIDQGGKVNTKNLNLSDNHSFTATDDHWAALSENKLKIDGETIELDYGLYENPQILKTNQGVFVSVTDTQTSKTYLFSVKGKLWSGFPVYGSSQIDLNNMDDIGHLELLIKGEDDRILIYQVD
jgi:hypothetical protein